MGEILCHNSSLSQREKKTITRQQQHNFCWNVEKTVANKCRSIFRFRFNFICYPISSNWKSSDKYEWRYFRIEVIRFLFGYWTDQNVHDHLQLKHFLGNAQGKCLLFFFFAHFFFFFRLLLSHRGNCISFVHQKFISTTWMHMNQYSIAGCRLIVIRRMIIVFILLCFFLPTVLMHLSLSIQWAEYHWLFDGAQRNSLTWIIIVYTRTIRLNRSIQISLKNFMLFIQCLFHFECVVTQKCVNFSSRR